MTETLHITVESTDEFHERVLEDLEAIERGDDVDDVHVLSLPGEAELSRLFSEKNLELLRTIARREPASMREAARFVERDVKEVSRNLYELESLGVIEFEEEGRSKRPVVWYDELDINFPLRDVDKADAAA
jgi:predicted transcriptional regulator